VTFRTRAPGEASGGPESAANPGSGKVSMILSVRTAAEYELGEETYLYLMVEPPLEGPTHRVLEERLTTTPVASCQLRQDPYGNPQRHIIAPPGRFAFTFTSTVEVTPNGALAAEAAECPPPEMPPEVLAFTLPSRYCQSDLLARMAASEFGGLAPGGGRVAAIADWVRQHVEYRYGTTDAKTSAFDTATERVGVCRDFAHLVIAFCRALGIPARYASGYALGLEPPDFHGYAQVYLGGAWHNVDATFEGVRPALVPIAVGRDAADVAMATSWSPLKLIYQTVEVGQAPGDRSGAPIVQTSTS
jgi:transglutaminase-like putative cysteine protease